METERYLAFDFGASSGRAIIGHFDGETIRLEEIHRFSNDPVMINGHYYWDIFRLFFEIKQGLIKYAQGGYGALSGIGIDTWGVDFGLIGPCGELLGVPYHYRDSRTDGMLEEAQKRMPREEIFRSSGVSFEFFNTLNQLLAMVKQDSPALKNAKHLLFIPDLFAYFLTGNIGTEFCEATTSQLVDPATRTWSDKLIKAMGIPAPYFFGDRKAGHASRLSFRGHSKRGWAACRSGVCDRLARYERGKRGRSGKGQRLGVPFQRHMVAAGHGGGGAGRQPNHL